MSTPNGGSPFEVREVDLDVTIVSATVLTEAVLTGLHLSKTAMQQECVSRDNVGFSLRAP